MKKIKILLIAIVAMLVIWLSGRYGWKLLGFSLTKPATIESVEVNDGSVHIAGRSSNLIPKGFIGYVVEQDGDNLYVGYNFSSIFGMFETGAFDIIIETDGEVKQVYTRVNGEDLLVYPQQ